MQARLLGRVGRGSAGLAATLVSVGLACALGLSATASAAPPRHPRGASATTTTTEPKSKWRGNGPPCEVVLPEPPGWFAEGKFWTCPPKRVVFIGDSVADSMSIETVIDEENWGVVQKAAGILGCGFITGLEVDFQGHFVSQSKSCLPEFSTWRTAVEQFKPQLIIVELGWWDSMVHLRDGHVVGLGQDWYDTTLVDRIVAFVKDLAVDGDPPIDFLTVPWMDPPKFPNGATQPAATPAYHDKIDALLAEAVKDTAPRTRLINVSPYITPAGHYEFDVDGQQCRERDGVHLFVGYGLNFRMTACGRALQAGVFSQVRAQLQH